ncbi:MAG: hypothetical protein ACAI44_13445 [Candidatus Sericytochromatia bacterium]
MDLFSQGADALERQDYVTACQCFEAFLQHNPQDADAWHNLGLAHFYRLEARPAQRCWQQALAYSLDPAPVEETIFEAADSLVHEHYRSAEAIGLYDLLLDSPRYQRQAHLFKIWCLLSNNRAEDAALLVEAALKKFPNDLAFRLQNTFLLPQVYRSGEDFSYWRRRLLSALDQLEAWIASQPAIESSQVLTYSPIFSLMPMGMNERETFQRISRIWRQLFVATGAQAPVAPPPGPRLRLGLISASVWNHSTMHYFLGMFELLAQEADIETALFDFGARSDGMTELIKSLVHHYVRLPRELEPGIAAIRDFQPEILMYLDIGQETLLYTMAHYRLAPVQCVTAGVPVTTGIDTMDYYFSSRCFELEQAQEHYSETLIRLTELMVCMRPPEMPSRLKDRAAFGIPAEAHVYFFPHTLFRVDPELDDIMAAILTRDPQAQIYLMRFLNTGFHVHLQARFAASHPELNERLHFLPWMSQPEFLNLLALADVALDALRLAGGNVSFQSFWVGTPMITCPTPYLRGRIASGLYRLLGLDDWIATDWQDYLEKALKLGTDPDTRAALSARILAGRDQIFNRSEGMQEMFSWFRKWRNQLTGNS